MMFDDDPDHVTDGDDDALMVLAGVMNSAVMRPSWILGLVIENNPKIKMMKKVLWCWGCYGDPFVEAWIPWKVKKVENT